MKGTINKQEALAKLKDLEVEMGKLKQIIESPGSITDRISDLDDVFTEAGVDVDDVIVFKKAKTAREKYINSCAIIPVITKAYNEGKKVDWTDSSTKYLPVFEPSKTGSGWSFRGCYGWRSHSSGPSGHHFLNSDHLKDACSKFEGIYSDYYSYKG